MFKLSIFATTLAVGLCSFFSGGCAGTKTTAEEPEEALAVAIKLLEAKDRIGFVKRFMPPAELQRHGESRGELTFFGTDVQLAPVVVRAQQLTVSTPPWSRPDKKTIVTPQFQRENLPSH